VAGRGKDREGRTPPKLDHYVGRPIEGVISYGKHPWEWAIRLAGGVLFKNYDKRRTAQPTFTQGMPFAKTGIDGENTNLSFVGSPDIPLTTAQYSIADVDIEAHPSEAQAAMLMPAPEPDFAGDRMAAGPVKQEEAPKKKATTKKATTKSKRGGKKDGA
jgi:hypothetical protein